MSKKKKLIVALAAAVLTLGIGFLGYNVYWANHPDIHFGRARPLNPDADFYMALPTISYLNKSLFPIARSIDNKLTGELLTWLDGENTSIKGTYAGARIAGYGEVKNGQTHFWLEGTVTTKDGETIPYFEEKVFDWVLVPDEALSDLKTSPF